MQRAYKSKQQINIVYFSVASLLELYVNKPTNGMKNANKEITTNSKERESLHVFVYIYACVNSIELRFADM